MSMRPSAIAVKPLDGYWLELEFSNHERRVFDVKPYLGYPSFLRVKDTFSSVHVAGLSVEWDCGADICPDELYYDSVTLDAFQQVNRDSNYTRT